MDPVKHVYTKILDSFRGDKPSSSHDNDDEDRNDDHDESNNSNEHNKILAEIVITPDHLTNGFLEDSQLVIQLFIDQFFLTMRIMARKGM